MTFIKLQFKPGVNRDQTDYSNEGGWYACDKIRFRSGYPQKIGGWVKTSPTAFIGVCRQMWNWITTYSDNLLALGTNEKVYIEAGGYFYDITPLRDTTPTLSTPNTDNCINTSNGLTTITVNLGTSHGAQTGDYVQISGVAGTTIGGVPVSEINGNHEITVIDADSFSFTATTAATSSTSNQGGTAIVIGFEISPGNAITTAGYGWGVGTWGRDSWGLGTSGTPTYLPQRDWWFDNFDNDLVMNIRNGEGYWWVRGTLADPATALATKAVRLVDYATSEGFSGSAVPVKIMQLLVSQQDKHLIAFGAVPFGSTSETDFDPLLIRWADQDTPADWDPNPAGRLNTAGFLRVSRGSRIVRAMPTRQEVLVWTDTNLYTLQFLGTTDVFGLQEYADNISVASPRAMASAANITYWMGKDKFYAYTGRVETLPCTLRDHVFANINLDQGDQIICGTNEEWNEVWWFYPTADSDYNNAYVVYNHLERIWYYGTIDRTAWLDTPLRANPVAANTDLAGIDPITVTFSNGSANIAGPGLPSVGTPVQFTTTGTLPTNFTVGTTYYVVLNSAGASIQVSTSLTGTAIVAGSAGTGTQTLVGNTNGYLYNHEDGLDDDAAPMESYIQSSDFDLEDGDQFMLTRRILPDIQFAGSTANEPQVTLQVRPRNFPGRPASPDAADSQPVIESSVGQYTDQVFVRARARQMALKVQSDQLGVNWQLGAPRLDARADGRR